MATRESVNECLERCKNAMDYAQEQYKEAAKQEHNNAGNFSQSQLVLESAYNDLDKLLLSANTQQREELHRMRLQLQQTQNSMILLEH